MGKKARKTRWRTLTIADEHSDSEESSTTSTTRLPKGYQPKPYYNKFPYSSQSTPRRRYQHDCTKSTRSSSTASENKITFNEDEYTKITTPRQDVLFKKGYLNKPKNYQTQTSTGTSTTSTGNSTGNGTPDHQSTDLEYESQFVFPNGFVDQNGIYYVNGYESYPLMLYNPPTYYHEYSNCRSKRYSTDSLTESMSPNNEEATSQDMSGGEASNNVSDYSGHHHVYNMVYPGYYVNGVCPPNGEPNGQDSTDQIRKIKKRRRRKSTGTKSQSAQDSSECTEDESDSCNEENSPNSMTNGFPNKEDIAKTLVPENYIEKHEENRLENDTNQSNSSQKNTEENKSETVKPEEENSLAPISNGIQENNVQENDVEENSVQINDIRENGEELKEENNTDCQPTTEEDEKSSTAETTDTSSDAPKTQKYDLKPDAEEFVPRAYRNSEIPLNPNLQYIKVPPNFVPIPLVPLDFNGQNFNPAFIPPGIPINFLPPDPKMFPNVIGFVQNPPFAPKSDAEVEENQASNTESINNPSEVVKCDISNTAKEENPHQIQKPVEKTYVQNGKTIDIATIVSKLEEAAKEQENYDAKKNSNETTHRSPRRKYYENKYFRSNQKYNNYKRNHYSSAQNSPQRNSPNYKLDNKPQNVALNAESALNCSATCSPEHKFESKEENPSNSEREMSPYKAYTSGQEDQRGKNSPIKFKQNWKQSNQNGTGKWQQNGVYKNAINKNYRSRQNFNNTNIENREKSNYKKFSEMVQNKTPSQSEEQKKHENLEPTKEIKIQTTPPPKNIAPQKEPFNQWISVSNKKKRKNKTVEENDVSFDDHFEEEKVEEPSHADVFESYDVNQLVDVVPSHKSEEITSENKEDNNIEDIIQNIAENIPTNNTENELTISMRCVSEIENELIVKKDQIEEDNNTTRTEYDTIEDIIIVETSVEETPQLEPVTDHEEAVKSHNKKKSKKGTQKPLTKRVIITDVDLSMNCQDVKPAIKKQPVIVENIKPVNEKSEECVPFIKAEEDDKFKETVTKSTEEEEKKKGKKKKKKSPKPNVSTGSLSSSNTTINVDESYDFLLDSALTDESTEKTNIEISQELDKIIQKGMYSNLEEKIKLLNIDESDGFFKSIFSKISSRESSVEKTAFTKTPDLSKILQNTTPLFKTSSVSQENNSQNKDINKILPDLAPPDEDGVFLENPDQLDTPQNQDVTNDVKDEDKKDEDSHTNCETVKEPKLQIEVEQKTLYPITQAVKDWMCRTRETTPDVEILKSPSAIYKEFFDSASETETEVNDSKTLGSSDDLSTAFGDEEITIFKKDTESRKSSTQQDLMEYWENNLETGDLIKHSEDDQPQGDCQNKDIEQGEDVVEVYESKYGKNEDFLRIQREVNEKTANPNYAKHRNLPYRAICCDIM